jgi:hypothetical protein
MSTKDLKCEDVIEDHLANLEDRCKVLLVDYYDGEEEGFENWNNYPLAVTTRKETKIELSWGGPSDFLSVIHNECEIYSVTYHFQDWFDGATRQVREGSQVWEYAQTVITAREECGY